jgi:hypothetical protein
MCSHGRGSISLNTRSRYSVRVSPRYIPFPGRMSRGEMLMNFYGSLRARRTASRSLLACANLHAARAEPAAEEHSIFQAQDGIACQHIIQTFGRNVFRSSPPPTRPPAATSPSAMPTIP